MRQAARARPGANRQRVTVTVTSTAPGATVTSSSECDTGALQCCNSVQTVANDAALSVILALVGAVVQNVNVPVGLTCSPITVVGTGSTSWLVLEFFFFCKIILY